MSRMIALSFVAALLVGCATGAKNVTASSEKYQLACAEVGLDPGSVGFAQCVAYLSALPRPDFVPD
jgi:hypothetical protein